MKASFLEPKRTNLSRNATSSELLDVKPNPALIRKSSAPALAVSEITGKVIEFQMIVTVIFISLMITLRHN